MWAKTNQDDPKRSGATSKGFHRVPDKMDNKNGGNSKINNNLKNT